MEFNITKKQILDVAKKYGLKVKESDTPGFYLNETKINLTDVFSDLLKSNEKNEEFINLNIQAKRATKTKKINIEETDLEFYTSNTGVA